MSQDRSKPKYANSNLNGVFATRSSSVGTGTASGGVNRFGMLTMSLPKVHVSETPPSSALLYDS
jgi:hypothetical protein